MRPLFAAVFVAALAIPPPATAKKEPKGVSMPDRKKGAPPADHDFGCDLTAFTTTPWTAKGMNDVGRYTGAFHLLKSVNRADAPSTLRHCTALPTPEFFVKEHGGGGVTRADIVVAIKDVKVYRAFSEKPFACGMAAPAGKWGSWWSLVPLPGPSLKGSYRDSVGVCEVWNDFSMQVECTLKAGSVVAVGPTQAADCSADNSASIHRNGCAGKSPGTWHQKMAAKPAHQLYLNAYKRSQAELSQFLTDCTERRW